MHLEFIISISVQIGMNFQRKMKNIANRRFFLSLSLLLHLFRCWCECGMSGNSRCILCEPSYTYSTCSFVIMLVVAAAAASAMTSTPSSMNYCCGGYFCTTCNFFPIYNSSSYLRSLSLSVHWETHIICASQYIYLHLSVSVPCAVSFTYWFAIRKDNIIFIRWISIFAHGNLLRCNIGYGNIV